MFQEDMNLYQYKIKKVNYTLKVNILYNIVTNF